MTTLTVNITKESDLSVLQEILDRFGLNYVVDTESEHSFSQEEIEGFIATRQDYLSGKTTARDWNDIEKDLNSKSTSLNRSNNTG